MEGAATTTQGLEEIAIREIKELTGKSAEKAHLGLVRFECSQFDLFKLNFLGRSLHRVIMLLLEDNFAGLEDVYRKVKGVDFSRCIMAEQSFAVRAKRCGKHDFTSVDVAATVGQAVIDSYMEATGKRLKVNLEKPDVIVRVEVRDDSFWVGIDTTGEESLARRGYRSFKHPASLKPTIAYSLVRLSGWRFDESLIDPVCGSGTIPIEAARYACGIPNTKEVKLYSMPLFDSEPFLEFRRKYEPMRRELRVFGSDINGRYLKGAEENARLAGVSVTFFKADACELLLNYDIVVANPPYGIRMGSPRKVEKFYERIAANLRRHDTWRSAVIITARPSMFVKYMGTPEREINMLYGDLPAKVLVYS